MFAYLRSHDNLIVCDVSGVDYFRNLKVPLNVTDTSNESDFLLSLDKDCIEARWWHRIQGSVVMADITWLVLDNSHADQLKFVYGCTYPSKCHSVIYNSAKWPRCTSTASSNLHPTVPK
jgi:hypothetical protein